MVNISSHSRLLLSFVFATGLGLAGAASVSQASAPVSRGSLKTVRIRSTGVPKALTSSTFAQSEVPQQTRAGHDYALDPFGFLGGDQPVAADPENPSSTTALQSTTEEIQTKHTSTSNTGASMSITNTNTYSIIGTPGQDYNSVMTSKSTTASTSSTVNETAVSSPKQNASTASNTSSGMNSWKIIGIGVVTFVGVLTFILAVTFHDAWWGSFLRPVVLGKRKGKDDFGDEQLIPDWNRRSWRFGIEEKEGADRYPTVSSHPSALKLCGKDANSVIFLNEENEKVRENLAFPLPPISPFPPRRTASVKSNGNNDEKNPSDQFSIIPTLPPAAHTSKRQSFNAIGLPSVFPQGQRYPVEADNQSKLSGQKRRSRMSWFQTGDGHSYSDAYGGIDS